jgi:phenylalanyl-tRNA synthetase alpha chain
VDLAELKRVLDASLDEARQALGGATTRDALEQARIAFLSQKGFIAQAKKSVGQLPSPDDKKAGGRLANDADKQLQDAFQASMTRLQQAERTAELQERFDVTLPAVRPALGHRHPLTTTCDDILTVLSTLGFQPAEGPEIEHDFYNFEALNIPADHPARDMQDTFYVDDNVMLRTHTSPVQIRAMLAMKQPPIRVACFGRVYRKDDDPTHSPMFHQIEGLYIDQQVTMADLKGTLQLFVEKIFDPSVKVRLRPSFFPFTEPSVEVDISCFVCGGSGNSGQCRLCKATGFIEIMGAGMVDPEVLKHGKLDPNEVMGFAFGIGVERVAMLRYGIPDIRTLYENDHRFLNQFR